MPTIQEQDEEREDRDWKRDPERDHLPGLVGHLGDLITDQGPRENNVPGVDYFVNKLQDTLKKGSDAPRWRVLRNAKDARDQLRDGYDEMRKAVEPLIEARKIMREAGEILLPAVQGEVEDAGKTKEAADSIKAAADPIETDPPDAKGPDADAAAVQPIEPRDKDLEPVSEKLKEIKDKKLVEEARKWAEKAKVRGKTVELMAKEAEKIEKEIAQALGQRRTRDVANDINPEFTAKQVIDNANKWLIKAQKLADKAVAAVEKLTKPDDGFGKVEKLAKASDKANMFAKISAERSAKKVDGEAKKVKGPIRQEWEAADQLEEPEKSAKKKEAVDKATESKTAADEAAAKAKEASEKAVKAAETADETLQKAVKEVKKLEKMLGPDPADDLPNLPDLMLDAPEPKPGPKAPSQHAGPKNVKSRGLKYPKVLDVEGARVLGEYGEGAYGTLRGH